MTHIEVAYFSISFPGAYGINTFSFGYFGKIVFVGTPWLIDKMLTDIRGHLRNKQKVIVLKIT